MLGKKPTLSKNARLFLENLSTTDLNVAKLLVERIRLLASMTNHSDDKPFPAMLDLRINTYAGFRIVYYASNLKVLRIEKTEIYV